MTSSAMRFVLCALLSLCFWYSGFAQVATPVNNFVNVGEGTLLSLEGSSYYGVVVYADVVSSTTEKEVIMAKAADEMGGFCVGYMVDPANKRGGLMFDMSKIGSSQWPPVSPSTLASAPIQWQSARDDDSWVGKGPVSLKTSVSGGKGWNGWKSFAKLHLLAVTYIGEGTLVSEDVNTWYGVRQYRNIASNVNGVNALMLHAIVEAGDGCVGYHMRPIRQGGQFLEAALLYDRSKVRQWPPSTPPSLSHAEISWTSPSSWDGNGPVAYDLSIDVGKGWNGWQCYAKAEMMFNPTEYVGEGTLLENTIKQRYYGVVQYSGVSDSEKNLWSVIRRALTECGDVCVGYHYRPVKDGQYLDVALLYDRKKQRSWPAPAPPSLKSAKVAWTSPSSNTWNGQGPVSGTASVKAGKGWNGWQCYSAL